jgi:hypothetical protein
MSFQWIIDRSEQLSIDRRKMVAQTTARDGTVRAVSRGVPPKKFTVKLPDGLSWTEIKSFVEAAEALDRVSTATITIPYSKFPWYYGNVNPGTNQSWTVRCVEFPNWTFTQRNIVTWSGPFVFTEVI